jgi:hypothetical protein
VASRYPTGPSVRQSKLSVDLHQSAFIKALSGPARAEIAEYLVRLGIDSISLLPDTVLRTALAIFEIKKKLGRKPRTRAA